MISGLPIPTLLLALLATVAPGQAGAKKTVTQDEIVKLLESKVPEAEIIKLVNSQAVDFTLTPGVTATLVRKGASDNLLAAIDKGKVQGSDLEITSPFLDQEVSHSVPVRGRSKDFSPQGKSLWLFAHRDDLEDMWWPQQSAVKVNAVTGEWVRGVSFGSNDDIGFDFEVMAIWVEAEVDRKLKDYIKLGARTGDYPPMPLPNGFPTASVKVRRVH